LTAHARRIVLGSVLFLAYRGCKVNKEVNLTRPVTVWLLLHIGFFSWQRSSSHVRKRGSVLHVYLERNSLSLHFKIKHEFIKKVLTSNVVEEKKIT
jgi:hypothetical protein